MWRGFFLKFVILLTILSLFLPAGGLLFPKQASANGYYSHQSFTPAADGYDNATTWKHELALGWAWTAANKDTGFISASAFSYAGGASAQAQQRVQINIPSGQLCHVTVHASIIYTGGTQKIGIPASSWGGVDKIWYIGNDYHKETLDAVFGWDDIADAAIGLGLTFASLGLSEASTIKQVVDVLGYVSDAASIATGFYELLDAGDAQRIHTNFSFDADTDTWVGVGFRVDTSGCVLGACDSTVLGYVESIDAYVRGVEAESYFSFDAWWGDTNIHDDSGRGNYGIPHPSTNGPQTYPGKIGAGIKFDGVEDWVEINFSADERTVLSQEGTLELWVKPDEVRDALLIYGGSGSSADGWGSDKELHIGTSANGRFIFYLGSNSANGFYKYVYFGTYEPHHWYHIAVTYLNVPWGRVECYINGQRTEPASSYISVESLRADLSLNDIRLGRPNGDTRYFAGVMDEVRIYSRWLSAGEISQHCWQGVDTTAPSVPVMLPEPEYSPTDENMVACQPSVDSESGVFCYWFRCIHDGAVVSSGAWGGPYKTFTSLSDGLLYSYQVKAKDAAGNESAWSASVSSTQDSTPPTLAPPPAFWLDGPIEGDTMSVNIPINANDSGSGIAATWVCRFGDWECHEFEEPYPHDVGSVQVQFPGITNYEGFVWIMMTVVDGVGNESAQPQVEYRLDTKPPRGSIRINGDAPFTNNSFVTLNLVFQSDFSGIAGMRFSNDGVSWSEWEDSHGIRENWELSSGIGLKTVYAQKKDGAGNISSAYYDTINYGPIPSGEIIINDNVFWTKSRTVTLDLNAENADNVETMAIWNGDPDYLPVDSDWGTYQATYSWQLSSGDGEKTVYVIYSSSPLHESDSQSDTYSDTIKLDSTSPTGSMTINGGASQTKSRQVTLSLSASDSYSGVAEMKFVNVEGGGRWTLWESYQDTKEWQLTAGEGEKGVIAKFRDAAGNVSSFYHRQIMLDFCPPGGSLEINGGAKFTNNKEPTLHASIDGEDYSMPKQFSSTQGEMGWYYIGSTSPVEKPFELCWDNVVSPYGEQEFYSWNSEVGEDKPQYLQITGPEQGAVICPGEGSNVAIVWQARKAGLVTITGELWSALPDSSPPSGDADDGVYFSIYKNEALIAGPINIFHSADLHHGTLEVPDCPVTPGEMIFFYIDRGKLYESDDMHYHFTILSDTEVQPCSVSLANLRDEDIDPLKLHLYGSWELMLETEKWEELKWTDWEPCNPDWNGVWGLPSGEGLNTVLVKFKDGVGNISSAYSASIVLDGTPPQAGSITINGGALETSSPNVTLGLSATDLLSGVSEMRISEDGSVGSWEAYSKTKPWHLAQEGECTLSATFKDAAGNISGPCQDSILYDSLFTSDRQRLGRFADVKLADVNGDGWLDLLATSAKASHILQLYLNGGNGKFQPADPYPFPSLVTNVGKVLLGDLDNDGDLDIVVTRQDSSEQVRIFFNDGSGQFPQYQALSYASVGEAALGDTDNDGDLDLILSYKRSLGREKLTIDIVGVFTNTGGNFVFDSEIRHPACSIALGDIDSDGDEDLLLGWLSGGLVLGGSPTIQGEPRISILHSVGGEFLPLGILDRPGVLAKGSFPMALFDMDGDGDLDLIAGGSETDVWLNDGSGLFSPPVGTPPFANKASRMIIPADVNNDGQLDLVLGEPPVNYNRVNLGFSWGEFATGHLYPIQYECQSTVALGDVDNDDDLDMLLGLLSGFPSAYYVEMPSSLLLRSNAPANSAPGKPSNLQAAVAGQEVTLSWDAGSDTETPAGFLTYNLRVGTTRDGNEVLSGVIPPGFGNVGPHLSKLLKLPYDRYYWSVQTVDGGFARSVWADERDFTIGAAADTTAPTGYGCNTPANNATNIPIIPTLTSTVASDATPPIYYRFRIATSSTFGSVLEESGWQTGTSWIPATTLDYNTEYWWQVKARDSVKPGNEGGWSSAFNFTTEPAPANYNLIVTCSPAGGGDIKVNGTAPGSYPYTYSFAAGVSVSLEAVTAAGYEFSSWTGDLSGSTNPDTITMNSDKSVTANFSQITHTLTVDVSSGSDIKVNGTAPASYPHTYNFAEGVSVSLEAVADADHEFTDWSGDLSGSTNPTSITMDSDKSVTANFSQITHDLTVDVSSGSDIKVNDTAPASYPHTYNFAEGVSVNLEAVADVDYGFSGWSGDLSGNTNPTSITMDSNKSVNANFSETTYVSYALIVDVSPAGGGDIEVNGTAPASYPYIYSFAEDESVNLEAVAAAGYGFSSWTGDLSGSTNPASIIMDSDKNVTANFIEFNAPDNVGLTEVDLGVDSITVTPISLGEVDTSNMPEGLDPQKVYLIDSTGIGSFTLRFTGITNASDIEVYKIVDTTWIRIPVMVVDATTIEFTMSVGDPVTVFTLPSSAPPPPPAPTPAPGGGPVGGEVYPVNKVEFLAPWLSLALIIVIGGSILMVRRRRTR